MTKETEDRVRFLTDRALMFAVALLISMGTWVFVNQTGDLRESIQQNTAATTELGKQVAVLEAVTTVATRALDTTHQRMNALAESLEQDFVDMGNRIGTLEHDISSVRERLAAIEGNGG